MLRKDADLVGALHLRREAGEGLEGGVDRVAFRARSRK
jgi:hypothetical protein